MQGSEEGRRKLVTGAEGSLHFVVSDGDVPILDAQQEVDDDPILHPVPLDGGLDRCEGKLEGISEQEQHLAEPGRLVDALGEGKAGMENV